jgi:hypothetical protein
MRVRAIYAGTRLQHVFDLVDLDTGTKVRTLAAEDTVENLGDDQIGPARTRLNEGWEQIKAQHDTPEPKGKGK